MDNFKILKLPILFPYYTLLVQNKTPRLFLSNSHNKKQKTYLMLSRLGQTKENSVLYGLKILWGPDMYSHV